MLENAAKKLLTEKSWKCIIISRENECSAASLKCTLFASISGYYGYHRLTEDPTTYMNSMTNKYWTANGITEWLATMGRTTSQTTIRQNAMTNINMGKPFIVGAANTGGTGHMVLVVGYKNNGNSLSDYLVLDSCQKNFSTLEKFFNSFPKFDTKWNIGGTGYVYGEFKKRLGISVILAALLLSGCQNSSESSQGESSNVSAAQSGVSSSAPAESFVVSSAKPEASSSAPAESSVASSTKPTESSSVPAESSTVSSAKPEESSSAPAEEDPPYSEPPDPFPADRIYPDDELVPDEWLRVDSGAEAGERVDEILKSDTSAKDPESTILALMNKNLLCFEFFYNGGDFV